MYLNFKKAIEKNPEEVQCIQFTEDIKKQLLLEAVDISQRCPASGRYEDRKSIFVGNGKVDFYPNKFGEYLEDCYTEVYNAKTGLWQPILIGDYLIKDKDCCLKVEHKLPFEKEFDIIED